MAKETSSKNEVFGRLLKTAINSIATLEGRTAPIVEDELGQLVGLSAASLQRYKAGYLPPEDNTVKILAEAAVQRGYLGREWLQRFLHAARYPFAEKLLDRLCPIGPVRPRPPRVYENLPAPTYSQFVMRAQVFAEVIDGLQQRSAAVLIVGLGGNGKTSLAREVAYSCLKGDSTHPSFDAVVWVSDKDRPGTTNLSILLDEIARTLDYPGFTQLEHEEKRHEVEQLLRRQRVLVCVDNFETITDGVLLSWLLNIPEPSKTLITSREYRREFRRGGWSVELRGMSDAEAWELVNERLRVLRMEKLVTDSAQLEALVATTGGNPKAIELTLGLVKYERRPIQQVVDDLYAARGELFDDLFTRAWALLDEAARRVLLVMTFFPDSASREALSATADVQGFSFDRAIERLADLALLDVQQEYLNTLPRYLLHPLVRAFAATRLTQQPEFEIRTRERWVEWYIQFLSQVGWRWNDLRQLDILDPEQETLYSVINWTADHQQHVETLRLARGVDHYYFVRGLWSKKLAVDILRIDAAAKRQDPLEECEALALHAQLLCRQGNSASAEPYLDQLEQLAARLALPTDLDIQVQHAFAFYCMAREEFDAAKHIFQQIHESGEQPSAQLKIANLQWLAVCHYKQGLWPEAKDLFQRALADALQHTYQRATVFLQRYLAEIDLDQGDLDSAESLLCASVAKAYEYQDRRQIALLHRSYARLHTLRGDLSTACTRLMEAIDLLQRIGIHDELIEARAELSRLQTNMPADFKTGHA